MSKSSNSISFGLGIFAGVIGGILAGVFYAPRSGADSREKVKQTITDFAQKHSPEVTEAKQQAIESIDLVKYKIERQYKKLGHLLKSKRLQKAKELEETEYDFN